MDRDMDRQLFNEILQTASEQGVSDVILAADDMPMWRSNDKWLDMNKFGKLSSEDTAKAAHLVLDGKVEEDEIENLTDKEVSYYIPDVGRFRISVYRQLNHYRLTIRVIPNEIRSFEELNLPTKLLTDIADLKRGLVLVTGSTGQGKSTTLASIIDYINKNFRLHIITIEDPVEFIYQKACAIVTQREVGDDVDSYKQALRFALRQRPDVILPGEIRDRETFEAVLEAAETGHLVLSAIHTEDTVKTFDRILGFYSEVERRTVRARLSNSLRTVISQRLLPSKAGINGRIPAVEVLQMTEAIKECLREQDTKEHTTSMKDFIEKSFSSDPDGMRTFDQDLMRLFSAGKISRETAAGYATSKAEMERFFQLNAVTI